MLAATITKVRREEPAIRLFMSDGSERSTYMPQGRAVGLLGAPHAGVNLMSCYYPRQTFWPERRLFSEEVPHYRWSVTDQTENTRLTDSNDWTDGYYSFDIEDADNDAVRQMEDVRRYGQDVRLTLTADLDTPAEDLERIADVLKQFGRMELRLNHEANGCSWFRFARNVGQMAGEEARRTYYEISQFFIRVHELFGRLAPNVTMVGCYNGPGERITKGEISADALPHLGDDELGLMYKLPGIVVSLDQYGSLHCGWPGHAVEEAPIIRKFAFHEFGGFALTPYELCELVIRPFQAAIAKVRGEPARIDLGELDFDEDFHGPEIRAQLVFECYEWLRRHPGIIGSITFYELTDMGGLGLFRQRAYGDVEDVTENIVTDVYRRVMAWDEFRHPVEALAPVGESAERVELTWRSSCDAEGLELTLDGAHRAVDFRKSYWRQVVLLGADGEQSYVYGDEAALELPAGTQAVRIFAPPPEGRDNAAGGFRTQVPVPTIT
ncbi:MAG: hypothetical protein AMK73_08985 [Planctomycetes bacterium SM23_32]|nr:MAG: hypothetical protein AMK73_08985 [Planctomycetes bacterium SM23_32]